MLRACRESGLVDPRWCVHIYAELMDLIFWCFDGQPEILVSGLAAAFILSLPTAAKQGCLPASLLHLRQDACVLRHCIQSIIRTYCEICAQEEAYQHSYAYDWRTKQPIIFRATDQWFASVDGFRCTKSRCSSFAQVSMHAAGRLANSYHKPASAYTQGSRAGGDRDGPVDPGQRAAAHHVHDAGAQRLVHQPPAQVGRPHPRLLSRRDGCALLCTRLLVVSNHAPWCHARSAVA